MLNPLRELLLELVQDANSRNPAYEFLLNDYSKYHFVMVILGGISVVALTFFAGYQFRLLLKDRSLLSNLKATTGKVHLYLGTYTGFLALALWLIVIGNLGNAINPKSGFRNSLEMLGTPAAGSKSALLQKSFTEWIKSGKSSRPAYINNLIDERLSWQIPKAVICILLLALLVYISKRVWATLVNKPYPLSKRRTYALFSFGILLSLICSLLLAMAIANTQGSIAPMALSLFFS